MLLFFIGNCNCRSRLNITIDGNNSTVTLHCKVEIGNGKKCSKRWLRQPIRNEIGKLLTTKSVDVFRAEKANEIMQFGDDKPPILHSARTLHRAKHDFVKSTYVHSDAFIAVHNLTYSKYINEVQSFFAVPFTIHYCTNEQIHTYQKYCSQQTSCITIDATGSICQKVKKPYKNVSNHIFLYLIVVNFGGEQFSVAQMLTESQNTDSIKMWLLSWIRSGAPHPKEVVVDFSRAILNALVHIFAYCKDVESYAENCYSGNLPSFYIRIDVAHFINIYVRLFKSFKLQKIRRFYLAAIG